jgi:hypothetical protein
MNARSAPASKTLTPVNFRARCKPGEAPMSDRRHLTKVKDARAVGPVGCQVTRLPEPVFD